MPTNVWYFLKKCCFVLYSYHVYERAPNYRAHTHTSLTSVRSCQQTDAPQKDLRPQHKRGRRGKSDSAWSIFVWALFGKLFQKRGEIWSHINGPSRSGFPQRVPFGQHFLDSKNCLCLWYSTYSCILITKYYPFSCELKPFLRHFVGASIFGSIFSCLPRVVMGYHFPVVYTLKLICCTFSRCLLNMI